MVFVMFAVVRAVRAVFVRVLQGVMAMMSSIWIAFGGCASYWFGHIWFVPFGICGQGLMSERLAVRKLKSQCLRFKKLIIFAWAVSALPGLSAGSERSLTPAS